MSGQLVKITSETDIPTRLGGQQNQLGGGKEGHPNTMFNDSYSTISVAIQEQIPIIATYNGQRRVLCPHALGTKRGRAQALFYQIAGGSNSGLDVPGSFGNWRCMALDKLTDVDFYPCQWCTAGNHSTPHT